jgi:hypothetical protein
MFNPFQDFDFVTRDIDVQPVNQPINLFKGKAFGLNPADENVNKLKNVPGTVDNV